MVMFGMYDKREKNTTHECLLNWKNKEQNTSAHNRMDCKIYTESTTQMRAVNALSVQITSETDRERQKIFISNIISAHVFAYSILTISIYICMCIQRTYLICVARKRDRNNEQKHNMHGIPYVLSVFVLFYNDTENACVCETQQASHTDTLLPLDHDIRFFSRDIQQKLLRIACI